VAYDLEYGSATLEAHIDAFNEDDRVLLIDDLLATGGTAKASCELVEKLVPKLKLALLWWSWIFWKEEENSVITKCILYYIFRDAIKLRL